MSDNPTQTSIRRSPPNHVCPFASLDGASQVIRRRDLLDLGASFTTAIAPMKEVIEHMKGLAHGLRHVTRVQLLLSILGVVTLVAGIALILEAHSTSKKQASVIDKLVRNLDDTTSKLDELLDVVKNTRADVKRVSDAEAKAPKLELVPETDPGKALHAPTKLRITPSVLPVNDGRVPPLPSSVEVSIPME